MSIDLDLYRKRLMDKKAAIMAGGEAVHLATEQAHQRKAALRDSGQKDGEVPGDLEERTTERVVFAVKSVGRSDTGGIELVGYLMSPTNCFDVTPEAFKGSKDEVHVVLRPGEDMAFTRGGRLVTRPGAVVILENAVYQPGTKRLEADYDKHLTTGASNEAVFLGSLISVERPYQSPEDPVTVRQNYRVLEPEDARTFETLEEFVKSAVFLLNRDGVGSPTATVRYFKLDDAARNKSTFTLSTLAKGQPLDPEKVVEEWLMSPKGEQFVEHLEEVGQSSSFCFEIIPGREIVGAKTALRGSEEAEAMMLGHESLVIENNSWIETTSRHCGYVIGVLSAKNGDHGWKVMTGEQLFRVHSDPYGRYHPGEVVTPNLPREVAALFEYRAKERGGMVRQASEDRLTRQVELRPDGAYPVLGA